MPECRGAATATARRPRRQRAALRRRRRSTGRGAPGLVNFADVAERINPAVVNIEATTRAGVEHRRRRGRNPARSTRISPGSARVRASSARSRAAASSSKRDGQILTNYHVIQNAERIIGEVLRRPQPAGARARHRSRHRHRADQGRRRRTCRLRRSAIPTRCGSASGCAPSAIRSRTSTR